MKTLEQTGYLSVKRSHFASLSSEPPVSNQVGRVGNNHNY